MQSTFEEKPSWLDRPLLSTITLNLELILFASLLVLAVISRFANLGTRVMSHDETSHVYFSWLFSTGKGYQHDPVTHGPLQFHLIALSYFLFGDNDFTARIPAALFGVVGVFFIWNYRRYLGRTGALIATLLFVISPYILYYARYARNESYVAFYGLVTIWAMLRYFETCKHRYLYYLTAATVFHFISKETAWIYTAQALMFLAFYFVYSVSRRPWSDSRMRATFLSLFFAGVLILNAAFIVILLGRRSTADAIQPEVPAIPGQNLAQSATNIITPLGILLVVLAGVALIASLYFLVKGYTLKSIRAERSFDLIMLLGTFVLPLLSAFPLNAIGLKIPTSASAVTALTFPDILKMALVVGGMIVISVLLGLWWNWRLWLGNAALFWTIFIVFYTSLFTNGAGIATGLVGSLGYWLEQQGVNRGSQPPYYYWLVQIPIYEYLTALGCLLALALIILKSRHKVDQKPLRETPTGEILNGTEEAALSPETTQEVPVLGLLGFWVLSSLVSYTIAGEKMPWLTVHIALPMILLSGWAFGTLIDTTDWKFMKQSRGWLILALLFVFVLSLSGFLGTLLGGNPPFQGKELAQLQATSNFLTALVVTIASGWGLIYLMRGWNTAQIARLFTLTILSILTVLTARTAYMANFINYDYATEFLVYAHTGPGAKTALAQIEEISRRTTDGLALSVAYDDKTSYPYWWYLRHYTNVRFFGANPTRDLREVAAILVGDANYGKIEPVVGQAYYPFEYIRMWWPNQDYFGLTWQRIWEAITNPQMRAALFQIWLNRDYSLYGAVTGKDMSLPNWDPSEKFRLYIRKDVAAQMWNYGTSPAPAEIVADPYEGKELVLAADKVFGTTGTEPGQFQNPHNLAIAPDGSLYVLDSGNARVQHLSSDGDVLGVWGSFADINQGDAPGGTFNDPWGIAVVPDGSVYVADTWNHRIQKFTADGEFITMWGYGISQTEDPFGFYGPRGIAVDADGNIYVTDTGNDRFIVFDSNGGFINQYGSSGFAPGQLDEPTGITLDSEKIVYIADNWNQRLQSLAPSSANIFSPLNAWDVAGWYSKSLVNYPYLAVDQFGHLFATDPEGYRVLEFTTQGEFIRFWGDYGITNERFGLPQGIAVDAEGGVWVIDNENARLMHFTLPEG